MSRSTRTRLLAAACSTLVPLVAAQAAHAGTVRYTVPESPSYAIQDNGNGIVKVTYRGCVTADQRQTLQFSMSTVVTGDGPATFKVLKEEGEDPVSTFDPATVTLQRGQPQAFAITLAFTIDNANNGITTFRIKLDPASGEGLGEGAGIMVRIPCVLAPAGPVEGADTPQGSPSPDGPAAAPAPGPGLLAMPTVGTFPVVGSSQARTPSPCVATPQRFRLRTGELSVFRVVVRTNGQTIRGAKVRATYPGGRQVKTSDANGVVSFRIRPRRAGRVVLQSDVCFGADRVRVLAARAVSGTGRARFTG